MVNNLKCEECAFVAKCVAAKKLKPFLAEARVDLGVDLTFESCTDYKKIDEEE